MARVVWRACSYYNGDSRICSALPGIEGGDSFPLSLRAAPRLFGRHKSRLFTQALHPATLRRRSGQFVLIWMGMGGAASVSCRCVFFEARHQTSCKDQEKKIVAKISILFPHQVHRRELASNSELARCWSLTGVLGIRPSESVMGRLCAGLLA